MSRLPYPNERLATLRRRFVRNYICGTAEAEAEGPKKWTVSGNIVDDADAALAGVTVELDQGGAALFTDESAAVTGAFSFANVPSGTYTLTATLADYVDYTATVVVAGQAKVVAEFILNSAWEIAGTVLDSDDDPLVADVYLWDNAEMTGSPIDYIASGIVAGAFAFPDEVADGTYYVQAVLADYTAADIPLEVVVNGADVSDADHVLTSNFWTIDGTITDSEAADMEDVQVYLYDPADLVTVLDETLTASDGTYSFTVSNGADYYVKPLFPAFTFAPLYLLSGTIAAADVTGQDFVGTADV